VAVAASVSLHIPKSMVGAISDLRVIVWILLACLMVYAGELYMDMVCTLILLILITEFGTIRLEIILMRSRFLYL
jgi:type IV secretory pathway VirB2 component (pilin)